MLCSLYKGYYTDLKIRTYMKTIISSFVACVSCWIEKCRIQFTVLQCSLCTMINFGNICLRSYCARSRYASIPITAAAAMLCVLFSVQNCVDVDPVFVGLRIQNTKNNLLKVRRRRHRGHRSLLLYDRTLFSPTCMTATLFR